MSAPKSKKPRITELEIRLRELEKEYELATMGLSGGLKTVNSAILGVVATTAAAILAPVVAGVIWLSGTQLVIMIGILASSFVIYFALVFGRAARIKAEISETRKLLEIEAGKKVR